jgi:hypothetical protein
MVVPQRGGIADEFRSFMASGGFNRGGDTYNHNWHGDLHIHQRDGEDGNALAVRVAKTLGHRLSGAQRRALR